MIKPREEIVDAYILVYKGKRLKQVFNESSMETSINRIVSDKYYMHCNEGEVHELCNRLVNLGLIEESPIDRFMIDRSTAYKVKNKISKDTEKKLYD